MTRKKGRAGDSGKGKTDLTPLERTADLTRRLVSVPREKIEERERAYRKQQRRQRES